MALIFTHSQAYDLLIPWRWRPHGPFNIWKHLPSNTISHPRRPESSITPLSQLQCATPLYMASHLPQKSHEVIMVAIMNIASCVSEVLLPPSSCLVMETAGLRNVNTYLVHCMGSHTWNQYLNNTLHSNHLKPHISSPLFSTALKLDKDTIYWVINQIYTWPSTCNTNFSKQLRFFLIHAQQSVSLLTPPATYCPHIILKHH
jgi:hypothetical protein